MEKSYSASYAAAGVDITAGYRSVELMKQYVARTMTESCIGGLGGFGGLFELDCTGMEHPVLISGTDGVGTKLRIAMLLGKHDTIGIDCVAMCVNDVICAGAKPLVFLDYIACGKNIPEKIAEIVKGVAEGCVQAGCSLVGGETAEHPGMMPEDEYDLAGFTVGVVDKAKILDNSTMQPGDVIIALPSPGVHSNGFSLVRKIFDIDNNPAVLQKTFAGLDQPLGDVLRGDRLGQGDHHGPVPLPLVTGDEGRIVGARPQTLQGADDEVVAGSFLQHGTDRVRARVERLDRGGVGR